MENIDIIKEIEIAKKYDIVLMTTFNFEINFFERFILNKLKGNRINKISLFIDENEFNESIKKSIPSELGKKYMVNTIRCQSAFHPKLMLFLGKDKAKLIIGSGNLKMSGLCKNNEVFNVYEYNQDNQENLYYIKKAIEVFKILNANCVNPNFEKELFNEINNYEYISKEINKPQDSYFIDNYEKGVLEQLDAIINNEEIKEIKIAVPFYDDEAKMVEILMNVLNCNNVKLYIQNGNSTFPIERNVLPDSVKKNICVFDMFKSNESSNFYHGKVFLLKSENKSFILYGSSNCTKAALQKSFMDGGNFECNILDIGKKDEFDYFFEDMINKNTEKEFTCRKPEFKENTHENYKFNYSFIQDNKLIVSIKINKFEEINDIFINNIKAEKFNINSNNLIITLELNEDFNYNPKFLIKINNDIFYGWFINTTDLNYNRNTSQITFVDDLPEINKFDMDSLRDKYKYLDRGIFNYQDKLQYESIKQQVFEQNGENIEEDEEDKFELDENYIEYVTLNNANSELEMKKRQYEKLDGIADLIKKDVKEKIIPYISSVRLDQQDKEKTKKDEETKNISLYNEKQKHYRIATTEEKRFARYFKRRISGIFEEEYKANVLVNEYISNLYVVLNIFYDFMINRKINDVFNIYYITETLQKILEIIITKENFNELVQEEDKDIIQIVLFLILIIYKNLDYIKYHQQGKILLNKYNEADDKIRDKYELNLEIAIQIYNQDIKLDKYIFFSDIKNDFESLFDNKTEKRINEFLKKQLHTENYIIKVEKLEVILNVKMERLNYDKEIIKDIFREIKKYYKDSAKKIIITFEKIKPLYDDKPKERMKVRFISDMNTDRIENFDISKDGSIINY